MFDERDLPDDVAAVRDEHAPESLVFDVATDFETLRPEVAEDLGLVVDELDPATYPADWLPADAPRLLARYAGSDFTIGMPGDGSVAWTRQTVPPVVLVKPRVEGSPESFVDFLVAEALVQVGLGEPEHFLGFFRESYRDLDAALPLDPNATYQVAAALYDGWIGLHTRETFADWPDERPRLGEAWHDAGARIEGRLDGLPGEVARNETDFSDATELACAAIKHGLELPAPFAALDTSAYRSHGAEYAVTWAEKTFEKL
ncbi:hypothetical protein G9464_01090 [Halostella sp. JP-L12]|uniref:DUF7089 family protein n=1 Tax=Halostella TaxID=1843185 RepID=UPI000EF7F3A4|nr:MULTISPECIES: hypothetical protein [Halostella]NHN46194.1 hypothetical protein [Halostella sp. JP-L12]